MTTHSDSVAECRGCEKPLLEHVREYCSECEARSASYARRRAREKERRRWFRQWLKGKVIGPPTWADLAHHAHINGAPIPDPPEYPSRTRTTRR